ncbi:hypothetical protein D3C86_1727760 [compost metagenome]
MVSYTPAVEGSYSFAADSDWDYYGTSAELEYLVVKAFDMAQDNGKEVSKIVLDSLVDELYSELYNEVLNQISSTISEDDI